VEDSRFIDPLVCVRAEEIALRLEKIRGESLLAIAVEIGERSAECRRGNALFDRGDDRDTPILLRFLDDAREVAIEKEVVKCRVAFVGSISRVGRHRERVTQ